MTLVEILAVVVILGLLAVTLTVGITAKMGKAKHEIAKTQIAQISGQLQAWKLSKNAFPRADEGLRALSADPEAEWYLEPVKLNDPWGNAYVYLVPGPDRHPFEIVTYGSDGQPGGTGETADVSSVTLAGK
ncbi:MAG: type II secretion system major pseudopilin GspG [Planctomycetes bacterium]|nr:type II secretion system major pseudopilin GspG [Planctomycetota bacterium]